MTKLPIISGKEAIKIFQKAGWIVSHQKGSHVILTKTGKYVNLSIPLHKELDTGTLRGLIRDSGMSVLEFCRYLSKY